MKDPNDQFARWIMNLEETMYTIETRKGSLHSNADGLSRIEPCGGKRCICPGVEELEQERSIVDTYRDHGLPLFHQDETELEMEEDEMYRGQGN